MTIDAEGGLWVALWGGGAVHRYLDGRLERVIELPVSQPTSCCFGGAGLDELYITSAWQASRPTQRRAEPLAGALFRVRPGVRGVRRQSSPVSDAAPPRPARRRRPGRRGSHRHSRHPWTSSLDERVRARPAALRRGGDSRRHRPPICRRLPVRRGRRRRRLRLQRRRASGALPRRRRRSGRPLPE